MAEEWECKCFSFLCSRPPASAKLPPLQACLHGLGKTFQIREGMEIKCIQSKTGHVRRGRGGDLGESSHDDAWSGDSVTSSNFSDNLNWFNTAPPTSNDIAGFISTALLARSTITVNDQRIIGGLTIEDATPFVNWEFDGTASGSLQVNHDTNITRDSGGGSDPNVIFNNLKLATLARQPSASARSRWGNNSVISSSTFQFSSSSLYLQSSSTMTGFLELAVLDA